MTPFVPFDLFIAAARAVAPAALRGPSDVPAFTSGAELVDWLTRLDPVAAMIHARLTERERKDVLHVIDGMLREHAA
ncbi:MAG TPA: hypothetical protein VM600_05545 [Actinomycetota bacterium]|nr:hypothetical protein [Actinomycetota bacterium]